MGKLTKGDVEHVAKLSKLKLSKGEKKKYFKELSSVIEYIENLNDVDTSSIEPTSQTTGLENVYREDVVRKENCLTANEATSGTENIHKNLFKVPMILKEKYK